jgi:hypothetical protein
MTKPFEIVFLSWEGHVLVQDDPALHTEKQVDFPFI